MNELELKYGCNPNQKPSRIFMADGSELPIKVLCGKPGYINFLDAFNGWQLVRELKEATGLPAATSFKHVSPAGAAVGLPLDETMRKIYWVDDMGELISACVCICQSTRCRPHVFLRRFYFSVGCLRCRYGAHHQKRGIGWRDRSGIYQGGSGDSGIRRKMASTMSLKSIRIMYRLRWSANRYLA